MYIRSPAFENNELLPERHSQEKGNVRPVLEIGDIPSDAKSVAIMLHDPDAPMPGGFVHWTVWNVPPHVQRIGETELPGGAVEGANSSGNVGYMGPNPPLGTHRYIFYVYALDTKLDLPGGSDVDSFQTSIKFHILDTAQLTGTFSAEEL